MSWLITGKRLKRLADRHGMSIGETDILLKTLGQTRGNLDPRWNHFVALDEDKDSCEGLISRGLLEKKAAMQDGSEVYSATVAGRRLASRLVVEVRIDESRDGKETKWHDRYRRFLSENTGNSFGEWWNAENARRSLEGSKAPAFGIDPEEAIRMPVDMTPKVLEKEIQDSQKEVEPWTEWN